MNYALTEYFISFTLALIISFAATPIAKKISFKVNAIDIPKDDRRMHKKPIARLGGLAIISGFLVSIIFGISANFIENFGILEANRWLLSFIAGLLIIIIVAFIDDKKPINPFIKLFFQVLAAHIVFMGGIQIETVTNPFAQKGFSELPIYISYPLSILWIVGMTNAINFMDGLDGLAAGVSSISSLSLFLIAAITGEAEIAIITAALAGSTLGFLPYNFNPAKIFMGDTGSTFLGFSLAVIAIQSAFKTYAAIAITIPLLVLGLPLFDTIFAILRRILSGKSIVKPDRGHIHHRLIDMGLSHKQSVVVMYTASSALGLTAIVLAERGAISAVILIIAISVFIIGGAKYMSIMDDEIEHLEKIPNENEEEIKQNTYSKTIRE